MRALVALAVLASLSSAQEWCKDWSKAFTSDCRLTPGEHLEHDGTRQLTASAGEKKYFTFEVRVPPQSDKRESLTVRDRGRSGADR